MSTFRDTTHYYTIMSRLIESVQQDVRKVEEIMSVIGSLV